MCIPYPPQLTIMTDNCVICGLQISSTRQLTGADVCENCTDKSKAYNEKLNLMPEIDAITKLYS